MMKALIMALLSVASCVYAGPGFSRALTVNSSNALLPSTQTNFPVSVVVTNATLKTVGNSGHVQNASGFDILFWSNASFTTPLSWEMEFYSPTAGTVVAWVKIPSLSQGLVFYMTYGDASISTFQSTVTSVWDSSFKGVWHLPNGTALTANDSTINANNGALVNTPTATTGVFDGAGLFNPGPLQHIAGSLAGAGSLPATLSGWVKATSLGVYAGILSIDANSNSGFRIGMTSGNKFDFIVGGVSDNIFSSLSTVGSGTQYYFAVTISGGGGTGNAIAYLASPGGVISTQTIGSIATPTGAMTSFHIGRQGGSADYWPGPLDELRYSNVARAPDWQTVEFSQSDATFLALGSEVSAGGVGYKLIIE